jgi:hypothetical protein
MPNESRRCSARTQGTRGSRLAAMRSGSHSWPVIPLIRGTAITDLADGQRVPVKASETMRVRDHGCMPTVVRQASTRTRWRRRSALLNGALPSLVSQWTPASLELPAGDLTVHLNYLVWADCEQTQLRYRPWGACASPISVNLSSNSASSRASQASFSACSPYSIPQFVVMNRRIPRGT